jgi:hypothetical protein
MAFPPRRVQANWSEVDNQFQYPSDNATTARFAR